MMSLTANMAGDYIEKIKGKTSEIVDISDVFYYNIIVR